MPNSTSYHKRILEQVQTEIRALALDGIDSAAVVIQPVPDDRLSSWKQVNQKPVFPGISVTGLGQEQLQGKIQSGDDIGYPATVFVIDRKSDNFNYDRWLEWRETMFDHFIETRLSGLTGIVTQQTIVKCTFGTILDPGAWGKGRAVGQLNITVNIRRQRRP